MSKMSYLTEIDRKNARRDHEAWKRTRPYAVFRETSLNQSRIIESFYHFRAEPTVDSYISFLSAYFGIASRIIRKEWVHGHAISLRNAKHRETLLDATVITLGFLKDSIPELVDAILQESLPLDHPQQLANLLLSRFVFSFSLEEKFKVLHWVRSEYKRLGVPLQLPPLDLIASADKKVQQLEDFMRMLSDSDLDLSSPYQKVHLDSKKLKETEEEIFGILSLTLQLEAGVQARTVSIEIGSQPTHFLGFLIDAEASVAEHVQLESRLTVSLSDVEKWNMDSNGLGDAKNVGIAIGRVIGHLNDRLIPELKKQIGNIATKHEYRLKRLIVKEEGSVYINSISRPTHRGFDLLFRKRVATRHKKRKNKSAKST